MNIIGIDLGGTKILGVLADENGKIAAHVRYPTEAAEGLEAVVDRIAATIKELSPDGGLDALGLGIPGPLDPVKGMVYDPPNLPGWTDVPLRDMIRERIGAPAELPIVLVNDANAAALGEFHFGAGAQYRGSGPIKHLVYLTISTGVGGGVIADGKLLLGQTGMAAELGHIVIDLYGPRCPCGNRGCLEALASGTALAREGSMAVKARRTTSMSAAVNGDSEQVTAEIVVKAAQDGDHEACALMEREGLLVGVGVTSCIHSFNPQLVVLGGGVANAGALLFDPVRATVADRVMLAYHDTYEIVRAALGGNSGALGAVAATFDELGIRN